MEMGIGTDHLRQHLQAKAALLLNRLQLVDTLEVPIGQGLIRQRPQPLRRLQFG